TNEIAQSEAATGKKIVNYWLHGAFLTFGTKKKMTKSQGDIVTIQNLIERGLDPLAYRYLCLTAHYRSKLKFTWENLQAAQNALYTLREHMRRLSENLERKGKKTRKVKEYLMNFFKAVNDDLNMPKALTLVWKLVRNEIEMNSKEKYELLLALDKILAIDIAREVPTEHLPLKIKELVKKRERARKNQDWITADEIRNEIKKRGYLLEDTSEGIRWRKK
ncbi:unnamed protein product, partial [marine sediment metagenome]